jgi:hypothetical protein
MNLRTFLIGGVSALFGARKVKCCSFCRRNTHEAGPFVEGPGIHGVGGVFICKACVEFCLEILMQEQNAGTTTK